jgi:hypothetical protein
MAGELADEKPFEPPLDWTKEEIDSNGSSNSEDDLGKRHTAYDESTRPGRLVLIVPAPCAAILPASEKLSTAEDAEAETRSPWLQSLHREMS